MSHHQNDRALAGTTFPSSPVARTLEATAEHYGWTRTFIYNQLSAGKLAAVKAGRRTLIVTETAERLFGELPKATFRCPRKAA